MTKDQRVGDLMARFMKEGHALKWQLTDPQAWTEEDLKAAMQQRNQTANGAEKEALFQKERQWFEQNYGTKPVAFDETGRMVMPKPNNSLRERPLMPQTPQGEPLEDALKDVIKGVVEEGDGQSIGEIVKTLQGAVNRLSPEIPLKEDGVVGPKTALALGTALKDKGTGSVAEALALTRFSNLLSQQRADGAKGLESATSKAFGGLVNDGAEAVGLQSALNDFGAGLREDAQIGPKTKTAFLEVLNKQDPSAFLDRLGYNLGFGSSEGAA